MKPSEQYQLLLEERSWRVGALHLYPLSKEYTVLLPLSVRIHGQLKIFQSPWFCFLHQKQPRWNARNSVFRAPKFSSLENNRRTGDSFRLQLQRKEGNPIPPLTWVPFSKPETVPKKCKSTGIISRGAVCIPSWEMPSLLGCFMLEEQHKGKTQPPLVPVRNRPPQLGVVYKEKTLGTSNKEISSCLVSPWVSLRRRRAKAGPTSYYQTTKEFWF